MSKYMETESLNIKAAKRRRSDTLSSRDSEDEWLDETWYTYSTNTDTYHPLNEKIRRLINEDSYDMPETYHGSDDHSMDNYPGSSHYDDAYLIKTSSSSSHNGDIYSIKSSPGSSHNGDVCFIKSSPGSSHNGDVYSVESSPRNNDLSILSEKTDTKNIVIQKEKFDSGFNGIETESKQTIASPKTPKTDNVSKKNCVKTIKQKNYEKQTTATPGTSRSTGANIILNKETKSENKSMHIVTVLIPISEAESITEALLLLGAQNLGLNTEQWTVVDDRCNRLTVSGEIVAFAIDQPSFIALHARNFRASMGFKKVNFRVKKHVEARLCS